MVQIWYRNSITIPIETLLWNGRNDLGNLLIFIDIPFYLYCGIEQFRIFAVMLDLFWQRGRCRPGKGCRFCNSFHLLRVDIDDTTAIISVLIIAFRYFYVYLR